MENECMYDPPTETAAPDVSVYSSDNVTPVVDRRNRIVSVLPRLCWFGGIISGLLSMIFGFKTMGMNTGAWENNQMYGGDAYTGMQNAAAQAANNTISVAKIAAFGLGSLLVVLGLALIFYFLGKLLTKKDA